MERSQGTAEECEADYLITSFNTLRHTYAMAAWNRDGEVCRGWRAAGPEGAGNCGKFAARMPCPAAREDGGDGTRVRPAGGGSRRGEPGPRIRNGPAGGRGQGRHGP